MNDIKRATTDHLIHELLVIRWSPYGLADRLVSEDDLRSLFVAANGERRRRSAAPRSRDESCHENSHAIWRNGRQSLLGNF
jgi:hypothetical protein